MARSRNIKPAFFKNYELADAGPSTQLLFAGLWCLADKEGRLEDRPRLIKAELFPYYDCDVDGGLTVLERLGFVRRYLSTGIAVIEVLNFKKHQSPHHTEKESTLPEFNASHCSESTPVINGNSPLINGSKTVEIPLIPDSLIPDSLIPLAPTKPKIKPAVKPAGAEAPAWLPASWQTYTQHRKESRKPLTATAQTAAINKLERWKAEGKDISAIITQSVENGWSGLFEVKQGVGQAKPSIAPPKLSCCVCGGVLRGFTETSQGKMCGTCWDKR